MGTMLVVLALMVLIPVSAIVLAVLLVKYHRRWTAYVAANGGGEVR